MPHDGFNPLLWDCAENGCFNVKRRPKIETFAECFPGRINFGDVDGWVEINGYFCVLEWKGAGGAIKLGQRLTFESFTRHSGSVVFVVEGDAETMVVQRYCCFWGGKQSPWRDCDLDMVKRAIKTWVDHVKARRAA